MRTIPAQEIKRCGISAVDAGLKEGPIHIIRNNRPQYVVMTEEDYQELRAIQEEAYLNRIEASLKDLRAGQLFKGTAKELIKQLGLEE